MSSISQRISVAIRHKGMSVRSFEAQAGITQGVLSNAIKKDSDISSANLSKIIDTYDEFDAHWLLTGEGSMLRDNPIGEIDPDPAIEMPLTPRKIRTHDPDFSYTDNDDAGKVPIITESGFANIGYEELTSQQIEDYYYIKEFRNADFMLRLTGDTMYPRYKSGDLLACREIQMQTFWQWGKVHAVLTCNQGLIIRRVMPGDNSKVILMKADNPSYPDCRILLEEILTSAIVIGSISMD